MKIEKDIVDLAVQELRESNQPINLANIIKLTGYTRYDLTKAGYDYLVRGRGPAKANPTKPSKAITYTPAPPVEQVAIDHTVEAYTAHVQDNYFAHPETLHQVEQALATEVEGFQSEIYRQAINLLILSKQLQPQQFKPDHYIGHFAVDELTAPQAPAQEAIETPAEPTPQQPALDKGLNEKPEFIVLNETTGEYALVIGELELENYTNDALKGSTNMLKIYKYAATAERQVRITYF